MVEINPESPTGGSMPRNHIVVLTHKTQEFDFILLPINSCRSYRTTEETQHIWLLQTYKCYVFTA